MPIVSTYYRDKVGPKWTDGRKGLTSSLTSSRQKLPYVTGPYSSYRVYYDNRTTRPSGARVGSAMQSYCNNSDSNFGFYHEQRTIQQARSRLNNSLIKGRAALGITAATANQSFQMVAKRGSQLLNAYRALKKGDVRRMEKSLGILRNSDGTINHGSLKFTKRKLPPKVRKHFNRQVARVRKKPLAYKPGTAENVWLEYTFGWVPLVADVQEVLKVRSDPFEVARSHGTASLKDINVSDAMYSRTELLAHCRTVCTAGIKITNPNTALLTQLGLSNPLVVAWDVIPFSFVVDWFFGISRYLRTYNDMAGFAYVDPVTTVTKRAVELAYDKRSNDTVAGSARRRKRMIGIVNQPRFPTFQLPTASLWLAATSFSLLSQQMRNRK